MGRTKKNTYADYAAAEKEVEEVEETESDGLDNALGITPCEEIEPVKARTFEEIENDINEAYSEKFEQSEDENAIMTKSEARDYVEEQIDSEFMEDIAPVKLTLAQRNKKIAELEQDIESAKSRMSEIETIAELADSTGFRTMVEEIKSEVHGKIDDEDIKTSKDGLKVLEAVLLTEKTVSRFKFQFNDKKSSIKEWEGKIVELKAGQLTIFDGGKSDEEEVTEVNQIASNTSVDELAAVG